MIIPREFHNSSSLAWHLCPKSPLLLDWAWREERREKREKEREREVAGSRPENLCVHIFVAIFFPLFGILNNRDGKRERKQNNWSTCSALAFLYALLFWFFQYQKPIPVPVPVPELSLHCIDRVIWCAVPVMAWACYITIADIMMLSVCICQK